MSSHASAPRSAALAPKELSRRTPRWFEAAARREEPVGLPRRQCPGGRRGRRGLGACQFGRGKNAGILEPCEWRRGTASRCLAKTFRRSDNERNFLTACQRVSAGSPLKEARSSLRIRLMVVPVAGGDHRPQPASGGSTTQGSRQEGRARLRTRARLLIVVLDGDGSAARPVLRPSSGGERYPWRCATEVPEALAGGEPRTLRCWPGGRNDDGFRGPHPEGRFTTRPGMRS